MGIVLRIMGRHGPHGHRAFSELVFGQDLTGAEVIDEGYSGGDGIHYEEDESSQSHSHEPASSCGYLEDDDIEEW